MERYGIKILGLVIGCMAAAIAVSGCRNGGETATEFMAGAVGGDGAETGLGVGCSSDPIRTELDLAKVLKSASGVKTTAKVTERGIEVKYVKFDSTDATRWAGMYFELPDCSPYDEIEIVVTPGYGRYDSLTIGLRDDRGYTFGINHSGNNLNEEVHTYSLRKFDFSTAKAPYDPSRVKGASFYTRCPAEDSCFYVKSICLVNRLPERCAELSSGFRAIGESSLADEAAALPSDVAAGRLGAKEARMRLDELTELKASKIRVLWRAESARRHPSSSFAIGWIDGYEKVRPAGERFIGFMPSFGEVRTVLARGEREGVQVLCLAPEDRAVRDLRIVAGVFRNESGDELPSVSSAPVGRITVVRTKASSDALGEHFDPICEFTNSVDVVSNGCIQAFHVRFAATPETVPGVYRGALRVSSGDGASAEIHASVRVSPVTLPVRASLRTATSVYGSDAMGSHKREFELWMLKNYRINPFSIYSGNMTMTPKLQPVSDYVAAMPHGLSFVPVLYLERPAEAYRFSPDSTNHTKDTWRIDLTPEQRKVYNAHFKKAYLETLRSRVPEIKAAGLWDIAACYCFDEAPNDEFEAMKDLTDAIRAEFPDMKFISTLFDASCGLSENSVTAKSMNEWMPSTGSYNYSVAKAARALGHKVWYYTITCDIDCTALSDIRAELGTRAFALEVDGWLVWTVTRWYRNKPISSSGATGWNPESFPGYNGGGSYFAIASDGTFLPTLRAEAMRDGIEDHALLSLARDAGVGQEFTHEESHRFTAAEQRKARLRAFDALERR